MRVLRTIGIAAVCLLAPVVALAAASTPAAPPRASLTGFVCQKALDPPARAVSVTSVMGPLAGASHLAVDFSLLQRKARAATYTALAGPKLGVWIPLHDATFGAHPSDTWRVVHPVADLDAPAYYRFQVRFRWSDAHGAVIARASHLSRICFQPELRPDLVVRSVAVDAVPHHPRLDDYVAVIRNTGETAAGPFTVRLSDAGFTRNATVARIDARGRRTVNLQGPACDPSAPPTVTVDPDGLVDVSSRARASLTATCPAAAGSAPTSPGA